MAELRKTNENIGYSISRVYTEVDRLETEIYDK
jgi:hypothetical protein